MTDGAVDRDYDDSLKEAHEAVGGGLDGIVTEPMKGGLAIDLVTRQAMFVRRKVADDCYEYYESEGFDLTTYKTHPYLPVTPDDAVYECVYIDGNPQNGHNVGKTYDFPRGRLMVLPIHEAWSDSDE